MWVHVAKSRRWPAHPKYKYFLANIGAARVDDYIGTAAST